MSCIRDSQIQLSLYKKIGGGGLIFYTIRRNSTYCSAVMHALVIFVLLLFYLSGASSAEPKEYYSGYETVLEEAGPDSVTSQLREGDEIRESILAFDSLSPYFDWKAGLQDNHGLAVGTNILMLYQRANHSLVDDKSAAGYIWRWQGTWAAVGRGTGHEGQFQWRFESRGDLNHALAPGDLGGAIGADALVPGFGYSASFDGDFSVINWSQYFAGGRAGYAVGRLDFAAYIDPYVFQTFSKGFLNRAFVYNATAPTTGIGALGVVVKAYLPVNVFVGAGIYDANAVNGNFDLDTLKEHEYLTHYEIGWSPGYDRRKLDKIQITWWQKDKRDLANTARGSGWLLTASRQSGDLTGFLRYGNSDGGGGVAATEAASLGFSWAMSQKGVLYVGIGWADPIKEDSTSEKVFELGYQIQLSRHISIMPNVQYLVDPANNADQDRIFISSFRANITL